MGISREAIKSQPPYSIVSEHEIRSIVPPKQLEDTIHIWCKCGVKLTLRTHAKHVIDIMFEEMVGELPSYS